MVLMQELEQSAAIMMAPPSLVTAEQRGSAEQVFINFRKQKFPYAVCKEILEHCHNDYVLFQAASTIKEAIIREWSALNKQDIESLRTFLLAFITQRRSVSKYVQEQVLQVVAVIFKRGTVDPDFIRQDSLLHDVTKLMTNSDKDMQLLGCSMLGALLTEYISFKTSGSLGMSLEYHAKCKKVFETGNLLQVFQITVQSLHRYCTVDVSMLQREDLAVLTKLMALAEFILSWEFSFNIHSLHHMFLMNETKKVILFKPGPKWRGVVLDTSMMDLFFKLVCNFKGHSDLCHLGYQCLTQLGSVTGNVFPDPPQPKTDYLMHFVQGLIQLTASCTLSSSSMLGVSTCINRVMLAFPIESLTALPGHVMQSFLAMMTRLTCSCLQSAAMEEQNHDDAEDATFTESVEELLEAWATLLSDPEKFPVSAYTNHAIEIFNCYIQCHLSPHGSRGVSNGNDHELEEIFELEDDDRDLFADQLCAIGCFARSVPGHCIPLLSQLLEDKISQLQRQLHELQVKQQTCADSSLELIYEDLHWLLLISGYVLVDTSSGETPLIPQQLMKYSLDQDKNVNLQQTLSHVHSASSNFHEGNQNKNFTHINPIIRLTVAILTLASIEQQALANHLAAALSPQLGQTLVWVLSRWTNVYLMPKESDYEEISLSLVSVLGQDTECAKWLVILLLDKVCSNLTSWGAETHLAEDTVQLLISLAKNNARALVAVTCNNLWVLAHQYAANTPSLGQLPQDVRRHLVRALVLAGSPLEDKQLKQKYWNQFLQPLQSRFTALCQQPNFSKKSQDESIKTEIENLFESFCGVASARCPGSSRFLYSVLKPVLEHATALLQLYRNQFTVVNLILHLFVSISKVQLMSLGQADSSRFYELSLAVMQVYSKCNIGKTTNRSFGEDEMYEDMLLLMKLLNNILTKDISDLFPDDESKLNNSSVSPSDVVLFGLNIIIPLITEELLKYPRLCNEYFQLVTNICETCPEKLNTLPQDLNNNFMMSIDLGLKRFGPDISKSSLESICSFANFEFHQHLKTGNKSTMVSEALKHFLKEVFDLLLLDSFDMDLLQPAAEAFIALICCHQEYYTQLVHGLLAQQPNENIRQRLVQAFTELTPSTMELNVDKIHRTAFRKIWTVSSQMSEGFCVIVADACILPIKIVLISTQFKIL